MVQRICEKLCGALRAFRVLTEQQYHTHTHTDTDSERDTEGGERQAGRYSLVGRDSRNTHDSEMKQSRGWRTSQAELQFKDKKT